MGKLHHSKGEVVGVPGFSSRGIFLSYRREDAAPYARLLQYLFSERIPDARIFMDLDSIEAGLDFAEVIREAVNSCAVLVALIGRQWATLSDEQGHRRLDNPDDYVRFEVQTALEREVRVIPVLVDSATPLRPQQLPSELHKLARLNAFELSYARYQYDADRLVKLIQQVLAEASGTAPVNQSPPTAKAEVPAVPATRQTRHSHRLSQPSLRRFLRVRRPKRVQQNPTPSMRLVTNCLPKPHRTRSLQLPSRSTVPERRPSRGRDSASSCITRRTRRPSTSATRKAPRSA
jgi:TIR domain